MDKFADIRPYADDEVADVIQRLLDEPEMLGAVAALRIPRIYKWLPKLIRPALRFMLRREFKDVSSVRGFQVFVKHYMDQMIESSTREFTVSGCDQLKPRQAYLFISNHRDIALDPAFVNYALYHNGGDTVRIAIGDNLLTKPWASDLMRLNKSFIVRRSAKAPRQMLAAFRQLSEYIRYSLLEDNESVWIAQREGRAKNGNDRTEAAMIKMIGMAQDKATESFADYINKLNIIPVSISYEWDPLDEAKAQELTAIERDGAYQKAEHEDLKSIASGITGNKGHVHVHFAAPLQGDFADANAVAAALDNAIISNYRLHPSNLLAYAALNQDEGWKNLAEAKVISEADQQQFNQHFEAMPASYRQKAMEIYARPVANKLAQLAQAA
ncbi:1-acyl-sn-glycerol-3-phosphate acyltransferase [Spongiibacter sp. KMU-158]|uniref:1-acyl-sn-glycerol-3-phosphate acyltransferase n=2 Tax=Spongiibacter pelagi TaxID=2760804 RepID=A0A927C0Y9_9GAMM|nr:1-acyl-sn-glycerol-3-phosphate acyltransferase [Spongiibacter pelagi]